MIKKGNFLHQNDATTQNAESRMERTKTIRKTNGNIPKLKWMVLFTELKS